MCVYLLEGPCMEVLAASAIEFQLVIESSSQLARVDGWLNGWLDGLLDCLLDCLLDGLLDCLLMTCWIAC
jgi:hypothetical protein